MMRLALLLPTTVSGVFFYPDFNETTGLSLNGNSATTNCARTPISMYSATYATNDLLFAAINVSQTFTLDQVQYESTETSTLSTTAAVAAQSAMFGHRDVYAPSLATECPVRLRLTASQPSQVSSTWFNDPLNVLDGFETRFTFQITDHSKRCLDVKDQNFNTKTYQSCFVHGGDGFAFVLHGHPNMTSALGRGGMGWRGIANSIAVVFHTWPQSSAANALFVDHMSVYLQPPGSTGAPIELAVPVPVDLADGSIHVVKITYYNTLPLQYFNYFAASTSIVSTLKDISESRRVGCLVVFLDDGIANNVPLLAVPINVAAALRLPRDLAFVGFTSATGGAWEKHDVLAWYYCSQPPCLDVNGSVVSLEFDYATQSLLSTASYSASLYPTFIFPDTLPWAKQRQYFAPGSPVGVTT
ncbi:hypothetical protein SPRG_01840 [Saprolegnia parasitica CBS 223.65]|uniref:Legume lectin domain-containing protein n=1 Tax=Saprolegnia parasitica (strain CBS 223.65) TaxID=695850 RepID=A0A067CQP5_SAPPC|nr:hypothetical protein SPRG_01840 [Saprolegnia parasitica CBS 223.65]KDO33024.1 hypothetical protein SPRG_01840 [Saprolegnia parasitica CBS 223.65]|eukprot:XP_012195796.1 hypothetical protein SPRG_01840 [Saprolegnia parasitica CBS 223.65]